MSKYSAVVMHGKRGGEGNYTFEGPENLLESSPVKVMRAFMESVEAKDGMGFMDYEINAALKNKALGVVTVIGEMKFEKHGDQPFMCMITAGEG